MSKRPVTLTIAGQTLSIRTDADDATLREIVRRVDSRVADIRKAAPSTPTAKVHLLAALTLAEELVASETQRRRAEQNDPQAAEQARKAAEELANRHRTLHRQLDLLAQEALDHLAQQPENDD